MKPKSRLLFAALAVAISTQACFAAQQAALPEFKSKADLVISKTTEVKKKRLDQGNFYTGKPFDVSREDYLFKYRNYDSELGRWTVLDPSGYPDGANNYRYVMAPVSEFDFQGLQTISIAGKTFDLGTFANVTTASIDVPGSQWKNSTQDSITIEYSIAGTFQANATFMGTGVEGSIDANTSATATVQKGWRVKLVAWWNVNATGVPFKEWEVKTFE